MTTIIMSQFMDASFNLEQREMIENFTLGSLGLLFAINIAFVIWYLVTSFREKRRLKRLEERRKTYADAEGEFGVQVNCAGLQAIQEAESQAEEDPKSVASSIRDPVSEKPLKSTAKDLFTDRKSKPY